MPMVSRSRGRPPAPPRASVPPRVSSSTRESRIRTEAQRLKTLGLARRRPELGGLAGSRSLQVLRGRLLPFQAVNMPHARIVWFNFELARQLGLRVPADGRMTPELHADLVRLLAWRALAPGEDPGD